jgi:hypothetical protein
MLDTFTFGGALFISKLGTIKKETFVNLSKHRGILIKLAGGRD